LVGECKQKGAVLELVKGGARRGAVLDVVKGKGAGGRRNYLAIDRLGRGEAGWRDRGL
jgi:hypothetical protein